MNKTNLKSYAPQARKDFIAAVTARANLLGLSDRAGKLEVAPAQTQGDVTVIAGQAWPAKVNGQRDRLIERIRKDGFGQTMEAIAYTWFNRFAALRYMELHDYLGHGHRALSSTSGGLPDILTHATDLINELPGLNATKVTELKLAGNRDGELYRLLLVAQCDALNAAMPFLFERIDGDTELLLPDNLLRTDSVISKLVQEIPEEDWADVEIIGWLYQFYISEKKDQVIGKVVKSEDIPAATQLFTPNWIVQYLVQNSVGRLWLMANPQSTLASKWPYYIQPAEQTPEVQAQLEALIQTRMDEDGGTLNPETITVLDPACGSGHILVVAYDVLKAIYLERGYQPRAIPRLILENNLYGLDIDDRAAQMAGFALLMKARADDRRLFSEPPRLNVLSLQESKELDAVSLAQAINAGGAERVDVAQLRWLIDTFEHAKTFGSLIQIDTQQTPNLCKLLSVVQQAVQTGDLYAQAAAQDVLPLVQQALVLGMQFDAVVANPPYMGGKGMNPALKDFARENFSSEKSDVFAMFIQRCREFGKRASEFGFVTPYVWMFINSYEGIRQKLLTEATIQTLIQLEYNAFEPACVPVCCFVIANSHVKDFTGNYIKLSEFKGHENQSPKTLEAISNPDCGWLYKTKPDNFQKITGSPIAYWVSEDVFKLFQVGRVADVLVTREGMATADNARFLRLWHEVSLTNVNFKCKEENDSSISGRWFPYNKGGSYRKWYGNNEFLVEYENAGLNIKNNFDPETGRLRSHNYNGEFAFKEGITWSALSSGDFSIRYSPAGYLFDSKGAKGFSQFPFQILALLNSVVAAKCLEILSPTIDYKVGDILEVPFVRRLITPELEEISRSCVDLSKLDWDSLETSWDFCASPLCDNASSPTLSASFSKLSFERENAVLELKQLEEKCNQLVIETFNLGSEFSNQVSIEKISLLRADREKDCQRLISYAIGCMMGRYSLDEPGLIYAHAGNVGFDASRYATFPADADGIVPLTDELWFTDDAASRVREFLLAVWGADTLEENMAWLAESLGTKASETPDETIRRYLADKFFKDHLQTYKKRPIYWLFSSGKQGAFQALVYLHRYHEGTLARLRAEYVVPLTGKMQARIDMLQKDAQAASSTAARNKLNKEIEKLTKKHAELLAYDEKLRHYADTRITLDLDDGVKVNYGKFGDLLDSLKVVTGGAGDD